MMIKFLTESLDRVSNWLVARITEDYSFGSNANTNPAPQNTSPNTTVIQLMEYHGSGRHVAPIAPGTVGKILEAVHLDDKSRVFEILGKGEFIRQIKLAGVETNRERASIVNILKSVVHNRTDISIQDIYRKLKSEMPELDGKVAMTIATSTMSVIRSASQERQI